MEPLQIQSDKAKKYLNLRDELKSIEVGLFLYNIEKYKKELEEVTESINVIQENSNQEEDKLNKIKQLKEELKLSVDNITEEIEKMSNLGFESQKQIENLNSDINVAKTRISNNNENSTRYTSEIEEQNSKIEQLNEELEQKESKKGGKGEQKERKKQAKERNSMKESVRARTKNLLFV